MCSLLSRPVALSFDPLASERNPEARKELHQEVLQHRESRGRALERRSA